MAHLLVVGAGIIGLTTALAAARQGHRVTVLDQGPIPNPASASFDAHRMFRPQYGAMTGYLRQIPEAFAAWWRLWPVLGASHYAETGALSVSLGAGDPADQSWQAMRELGVAHQRLDRAGLAQLCPQLDLPDHAWGLLAQPGGVLFADRIVTAITAVLRELGADLRPGCRVAGFDPAQSRVWLDDGVELAADRMLIAAGAGLAALDPGAGDPAHVWRQAVVYTEAPPQWRAAWRNGPGLCSLGDTGIYALPERGSAGLKFGHGSYRRRAGPGDDDTPGADEGAAILAPVRPWLRDGADYRPMSVATGRYVIDGTGRFRIMQRGPATLVVTNCEGHMFKFGALLGERLALALDGGLPVGVLARQAAGWD